MEDLNSKNKNIKGWYPLNSTKFWWDEQNIFLSYVNVLARMRKFFN